MKEPTISLYIAETGEKELKWSILKGWLPGNDSTWYNHALAAQKFEAYFYFGKMKQTASVARGTMPLQMWKVSNMAPVG